MTHQVTFDSGGVVCVGRLYPATGASGRCVVLCAGFGGTQDTPALTANAEAFAAAGYHALTFDYRGFGESGGRPRQVVSIAGQLADIAAAVRCARVLPDVDPAAVTLWGTSLGGGHVVVAAARDPGIAAVIAQVPFNGFPRRVEGRSTAATLRLLAVMGEDWVRGRLHLPPHYIPAVGATGELAVMTGQDVQSVIAGMRSPTWRNEVAPRALLEMMRYRPGDAAARVACPLLVCVGDADVEALAASAEALATLAPHGQLRHFAATHFDLYRDEVRTRVIAEQIAFLDAVPD
jgi:pimeloyl-ACP methyl ester carboxylesterase